MRVEPTCTPASHNGKIFFAKAKMHFDKDWWRLRLGEPVQCFARPFGPDTLRQFPPWHFHDLHGTGFQYRWWRLRWASQRGSSGTVCPGCRQVLSCFCSEGACQA